MPDTHAAFLDRWAEVLRDQASRPALLDASGKTLATFTEIEREAAEWMEILRGFPAGSVIGVQLPNHPAWPAILLAIWRAGQVALTLDASLRPDLTGQILRSASARALVSEREIQALPNPDASELPSGAALLKVTSGTTDNPHLIAFSLAQILVDADNICATMGLSQSDINYGAIPFSQSYGFGNLLIPLLTHGIPLAVAWDNFPHAMIDGLAASRATVLPGVPIFFQALSRLNLALPQTVRLCVNASAPLAGEIIRDFYGRNSRKIHAFYGASECGGICYDRSETTDLPEGFVGQPLLNVNLEHDQETERIVIRSGAVGLGYLSARPDDALSAGSFRPGDLLRRDTAGYSLTGRLSDFINITGKKLDPIIVEAVIEKIPGVSRAVVCGIPHELRGERAIAVVESHTVTREDVYSACRKILAPWQMPSDVWLVEHFPAGERGKIRRADFTRAYLKR